MFYVFMWELLTIQLSYHYINRGVFYAMLATSTHILSFDHGLELNIESCREMWLILEGLKIKGLELCHIGTLT